MASSSSSSAAASDFYFSGSHSPSPSAPTTPTTPSDATSTHPCRWNSSCPRAFSDPEALYAHLCEDHVGRRAAGTLCLDCRWPGCTVGTLAKRDHLTSHLRIHVPLKPHVCPICARAFKRPQDLKKHEKVHGGGTASGGVPAAAGGGGESREASVSSGVGSSVILMPPSPILSEPSLDSYTSYNNNSSYPSAPATAIHSPYNNYIGNVSLSPDLSASGSSPLTAKRSADSMLDDFFVDVKRKRIAPTYDDGMMLRLETLSELLFMQQPLMSNTLASPPYDSGSPTHLPTPPSLVPSHSNLHHPLQNTPPPPPPPSSTKNSLPLMNLTFSDSIMELTDLNAFLDSLAQDILPTNFDAELLSSSGMPMVNGLPGAAPSLSTLLAPMGVPIVIGDSAASATAAAAINYPGAGSFSIVPQSHSAIDPYPYHTYGVYNATALQSGKKGEDSDGGVASLAKDVTALGIKDVRASKMRHRELVVMLKVAVREKLTAALASQKAGA